MSVRPFPALRGRTDVAGTCQTPLGRCCSGWDPPSLPLCVRERERSCRCEAAGGARAVPFLAGLRFRSFCLPIACRLERPGHCSQGGVVSSHCLRSLSSDFSSTTTCVSHSAVEGLRLGPDGTKPCSWLELMLSKLDIVCFVGRCLSQVCS